MKKTLMVTALSLFSVFVYSQESRVKNLNEGIDGVQELSKIPEISPLQLSINYFNEFASGLDLSKIENLKENDFDLALGKIDSSKNLKDLIKFTIEFTTLLPKQIKTTEWLMDTTYIPKLIECKNELLFNKHLLFIENNIKNQFKQAFWVDNKQKEWIDKLSKED